MDQAPSALSGFESFALDSTPISEHMGILWGCVLCVTKSPGREVGEDGWMDGWMGGLWGCVCRGKGGFLGSRLMGR